MVSGEGGSPGRSGGGAKQAEGSPRNESGQDLSATLEFLPLMLFNVCLPLVAKTLPCNTGDVGLTSGRGTKIPCHGQLNPMHHN